MSALFKVQTIKAVLSSSLSFLPFFGNSLSDKCEEEKKEEKKKELCEDGKNKKNEKEKWKMCVKIEEEVSGWNCFSFSLFLSIATDVGINECGVIVNLAIAGPWVTIISQQWNYWIDFCSKLIPLSLKAVSFSLICRSVNVSITDGIWQSFVMYVITDVNCSWPVSWKQHVKDILYVFALMMYDSWKTLLQYYSTPLYLRMGAFGVLTGV